MNLTANEIVQILGEGKVLEIQIYYKLCLVLKMDGKINIIYQNENY